MSKFIYTAKNFEGTARGGEMEAKDEKSLAGELRSEGFLVTSIKLIEEGENRSQINFLARFNTIPLKEKMIFARNLSVMVSSGLPVSRSVKNLSVQVRNKRFKKILLEIHDELEKGASLSDSLGKYPGVFSDLFVNMVKVGEAGGTLEESLNIIAVQLEKDHELISKVRGAMMYPAVIIVAMIGIGILMLTFILPKIMENFKNMNATLPASTRAIIFISDTLRNNSVSVVIFFILSAIFSKLFIATQTGKKLIGFFAINIPVIKNITIKVNCGRFARIYSSLLKSGVSVIEALKISSGTLSNYFYKKAINDGIEQVQKGVNLSQIISGYPAIFPPLVPQMIEVGEETGKIEAVLLKLAEFYEEEVFQITKNLSSIIEPILMIIIGSAVGFFAVSMLQPMYSLMENIK